MHRDPTPRNQNTLLKLVALGLSATALTGCNLDRQPAPTPDQTQSSSPEREKQAAEAEFQRQGKQAAYEIVTILGDPKNGAKPYWAFDGWMIGNKAFVVGPDEEMPTEDDGKRDDGHGVPEAYVGYEDGTLYMVASTGTETPLGEAFNGVQVRVSIDPSSEVAIKSQDRKEKLTIADVAKVLDEMGDGGTAKVVTLEGSVDAGYDYDKDQGFGTSFAALYKDGSLRGSINMGIDLPNEDQLGEYTKDMSEQIGKLNDKALANLGK